MIDRVIINEVGLRDGLQNQPKAVGTDEKLAMVEALLDAGVRHLEVTSFVSPKAVPQMADAAELFARLPKREDVIYSALVPNLRGCERALAAGVTSLACVLSSTDTMNRRNINMTLDQTVLESEAMIRFAHEHKLQPRAYIATAFGCPYEGHVAPAVVEGLVSRLLDAGAGEVIVADTIGSADPYHVAALIASLVARHGAERLSLHGHDTKGLALANCYAAYREGLRKFDASVGGLGGCPFAPGARGNAATEDLVNMFEAAGIATGIDLDRLALAVAVAEASVGQSLGSRWIAWHRTAGMRTAA